MFCLLYFAIRGPFCVRSKSQLPIPNGHLSFALSLSFNPKKKVGSVRVCCTRIRIPTTNISSLSLCGLISPFTLQDLVSPPYYLTYGHLNPQPQDMTPNHDRTNSCCKMRFASRFLRALSKMRKPTRSLISSNEIRKRSHRIKMAAYSSMAHAVGSRRAWSRAILIKLGSRARHHHVLTSMMRISKRSIWLGKKRVIRKYCPSPSAPPDHLHLQLSQENKLRKIVPGGKSMDICSLLEETAHFVRCLNTQVMIMQTIADQYSK